MRCEQVRSLFGHSIQCGRHGRHKKHRLVVQSDGEIVSIEWDDKPVVIFDPKQGTVELQGSVQ